MEQLIAYLYNKNVYSNDPNIQKFGKLMPVKVHSLTEEQLQLYSPAIIRNIVNYSPANMQLKLSVPYLFSFIRLHKMKTLMQEEKLQYFFQEWVKNQFMPIKSTSLSRKIPTTCQYIYIDNAPQDGKDGKLKNKGDNEKERKPGAQMGMINVQQLTKELQNRFIMKNIEIDVQNLKKEEEKASARTKVQWKKIQEYIYEKFCQDTLMVFNFVYSCPYIDEKELVARTMLPIIELRKCINNLVADGLINFYSENSRTVIFKPLKRQRMLQYYRNHIAQSLLNCLVFLDRNPPEQKSNIILNSISKLDDILLILM